MQNLLRSRATAREPNPDRGANPRRWINRTKSQRYRSRAIPGTGAAAQLGAALTTLGLLVVAGVVTGTVGSAVKAVVPVAAPAANAASYNSAYGGYTSIFGGWLGAVELSNGLLAYCLQPTTGNASGANVARMTGGYVDFFGKPLSDEATSKLGYVFDTYGQIKDKTTNQAVALYAYAWTGSYDVAHPIGSAALGLSYGTGNPKVSAKFQAIWDDANDASHYVTGTASGSGVLKFDVNPNNNFEGTVTMVGTAGSTGTIVLTNSVVKGSGANVISGVAEGTAIAIESSGGTTVEGDFPIISGTGTFTSPGGWGPGLQVWSSGGGQDVGSGGRRVVPAPFTVAGAAPSQSTPWIKTKAPAAAVVGDVIKDDYTWGQLPPQGADVTIVFYADKTCTVPVHTYKTHLDRPASGPNQGSGSTDGVEVKDEWIDTATGETIGHFTEEISVPEYNWTSGPSTCGQEGENTILRKPTTPASGEMPPEETPEEPAEKLPIIAG